MQHVVMLHFLTCLDAQYTLQLRGSTVTAKHVSGVWSSFRLHSSLGYTAFQLISGYVFIHLCYYHVSILILCEWILCLLHLNLIYNI